MRDRIGARTHGRHAALQMLFWFDGANVPSADQAIDTFWRSFDGEPEGRAYADEIVHGVSNAMDDLDKKIVAASNNWRLERMSKVDRNVLRVGAWELTTKLDVPRAVILDEAVELAKSFGSEDSGSFVNGVLDRIADVLGRVDADRPDAPGT
jgi:N utilization substance protein B